MIKHIIMKKLIWCVNDISNCGQAYARIFVTNKVTYNLSPEHILRLLDPMAKVGL